VTPEDKLRIAEALQTRGHVVAMTGDGLNDAPALREAAIGVAMGKSGTDVAREAADLVLLDDDFSTIVAAVEQGRSTFANVRRFLTYHLTDNVAELAPFVVWAFSGGAFPLAIGVLQVLALDIETDVLPALALGAEPPGGDVLEHPPTRGHLIDRRLFARAFGVLGPVEATISLAVFVISFLAAGRRFGAPFPTGPAMLAASGAAFTAIVFGQVTNAFAYRTTVRLAWQIPLRANRLLVGAVFAELAMLAAFLYIPPIAHLLASHLRTAPAFSPRYSSARQSSPRTHCRSELPAPSSKPTEPLYCCAPNCPVLIRPGSLATVFMTMRLVKRESGR
jgi:magnesium-transporting ATPase (P-type)